MADAASINARRIRAMSEVEEILERHDPEVGERLRKAKNGDSPPNPERQPYATAAYDAECILTLARIVDEQLTPKKRGRPPKVRS